jgi:polyisoprenoid-binding protein YceI
MKLWIAAAAASALALAACTPPAEQPETPAPPVSVAAPSGEYALDQNHSTVTVRALHFGLARYTLRFNTVSGSLNFNADDPAQSSVEIAVDTTSLDTPYSGDRNFDAELQNSEWLDSAGNPTATFRSTSAEQTGPVTARVTGDLTIRGVTHPATFDVTYNGSWAQHPAGPAISGIGFSARGTIQRSDYGLMVLQPSTGPSSGVADDVTLEVEAEFNRPIESAPVPPDAGADRVNCGVRTRAGLPGGGDRPAVGVRRGHSVHDPARLLDAHPGRTRQPDARRVRSLSAAQVDWLDGAGAEPGAVGLAPDQPAATVAGAYARLGALRGQGRALGFLRSDDRLAAVGVVLCVGGVVDPR